MKSATWGRIQHWHTVQPGELFMIEIDGKAHIALQVSAGTDRRALIIHPRPEGYDAGPATVSDRRTASCMVYVIPNAKIGLAPDELLSFRTEPALGDLVETPKGTFLKTLGTEGHVRYCDVATGKSHHDFDLSQCACFSRWQITVRDGEREVAIFSWPA